MPVSYPTTPDLTIKVGDRVRSYDFPGNPNHYIEGVVKAICTHTSAYTISAVARWHEGGRRPFALGGTYEFTAPLNGLPGLLGVTMGVQRITLEEEEDDLS